MFEKTYKRYNPTWTYQDDLISYPLAEKNLDNLLFMTWIWNSQN